MNISEWVRRLIGEVEETPDVDDAAEIRRILDGLEDQESVTHLDILEEGGN